MLFPVLSGDSLNKEGNFSSGVSINDVIQEGEGGESPKRCKEVKRGRYPVLSRGHPNDI